KATDSELTLMYVVDKVPDRFATRLGETAAGPGKTIADLYQSIPDLKDTIFEKVDEILKENGVTAKKEFVTGRKIADAILEEADAKYDLVVLGSGKFTGAERMLFGSVSYQVAESASVPVLVVKQTTDQLKNILVCTDGSESAKSACLMGAMIGKAVGAKVSLLTVAQEFLDEEVASQCDIECSSAIKEKIGIDVDERICRVGKGVKSVREEINKLAPKYDLIVMGSRGLSRLERVRMGHVSLSVKENADSNILIVRGFKL
ncbi:universal stress protein, partial [archaeon]|nr:universal stress protein [archaeon]